MRALTTNLRSQCRERSHSLPSRYFYILKQTFWIAVISLVIRVDISFKNRLFRGTGRLQHDDEQRLGSDVVYRRKDSKYWAIPSWS